jgi:hypothetical protein
MSSPAPPLPIEIHRSARRGELQKVVKWLRKGGQADALCFDSTRDGRPTTFTLLQTAAANGHLEMVRERTDCLCTVRLLSAHGWGTHT